MPRHSPSVVPSRDELLVVLGSAVIATVLVVRVAAWIGGWHEQAVAAFRDRFAGDVELPVLVRALEPGAVIEPGDVSVRAFPAWIVPGYAARAPERVIGRTVRERVLPGEPIREERLADPTASPGLEAIVPTHMRALSLNLTDDDRVSGFVEPGDFVDLLVTVEVGGHPAETRALIQAARVLTVDEQILQTPAGNEVHRPHVTLAVTPAEAERVAAALHSAFALKLVLRSEVDQTHERDRGVVTADLLAGPRLTVQEYRERVTDGDLARMVELVAGADVAREPVIDIDEILHPRM